jgi:hypothetical protein
MCALVRQQAVQIGAASSADKASSHRGGEVEAAGDCMQLQRCCAAKLA